MGLLERSGRYRLRGRQGGKKEKRHVREWEGEGVRAGEGRRGEEKGGRERRGEGR